MTKAIFNAESAKRTNENADFTEISFTNENGETQSVKLSAKAHTELISALLSRKKHLQHNTPTFRPIESSGARMVLFQNGMIGLEFFVKHDQAICVAFPEEAIPHLKNVLGSLDNPNNPTNLH